MASTWASVSGRPADLYAETGETVLTVAAKDTVAVITTQGRRMTVESLLRTLAVEAAIHHLDLEPVLPEPPSQRFPIASRSSGEFLVDLAARSLRHRSDGCLSIERAQVAARDEMLEASACRACEVRKSGRGARERGDHKADATAGITVENERFLTTFRMARKCAVGESLPVRFVNHVDDAARDAQRDPPQAEPHDDDRVRLYRDRRCRDTQTSS